MKQIFVSCIDMYVPLEGRNKKQTMRTYETFLLLQYANNNR